MMTAYEMFAEHVDLDDPLDNSQIYYSHEPFNGFTASNHSHIMCCLNTYLTRGQVIQIIGIMSDMETVNEYNFGSQLKYYKRIKEILECHEYKHYKGKEEIAHIMGNDNCVFDVRCYSSYAIGPVVNPFDSSFIYKVKTRTRNRCLVRSITNTVDGLSFNQLHDSFNDATTVDGLNQQYTKERYLHRDDNIPRTDEVKMMAFDCENDLISFAGEYIYQYPWFRSLVSPLLEQHVTPSNA